MTEIFRHRDAGVVSVRQSVLESAGISTFVQNSDAQQAIACNFAALILPVPAFWPTLYVVNDEDYLDAMKLLAHPTTANSAPEGAWVCEKCNESVPAHFAHCWNCNHSPTPSIEPADS